MSGVFYIGLGDQFDGEKVKAYPPGSVIVLPGNTWHFHWAKSGEYVTQVTAIGPLGPEYMDAKDDPQNKNSPELLRLSGSEPGLAGQNRSIRSTSPTPFRRMPLIATSQSLAQE